MCGCGCAGRGRANIGWKSKCFSYSFFSFVWRCWNCVGQTRQSTLKGRIKPSTRLVIDPLIQLNQPDNQPTKQDKYHRGLRPPMNMIIGGILCQIIRHFTRIRPISDRRARRVMPRSWCPSFTKDVFSLLTFTTLYILARRVRSTNCYHLVYQRRHASCLSWGSYYPWIVDEPGFHRMGSIFWNVHLTTRNVNLHWSATTGKIHSCAAVPVGALEAWRCQANRGKWTDKQVGMVDEWRKHHWVL